MRNKNLLQNTEVNKQEMDPRFKQDAIRSPINPTVGKIECYFMATEGENIFKIPTKDRVDWQL